MTVRIILTVRMLVTEKIKRQTLTSLDTIAVPFAIKTKQQEKIQSVDILYLLCIIQYTKTLKITIVENPSSLVLIYTLNNQKCSTGCV